MHADEVLRRRTFRDVIREQRAFRCERADLLRVAFQRMLVDGPAVAARQHEHEQAENERAPGHLFSMKLIAPLFSSTAHLTLSRDSICCCLACSINSSSVSRSFLRFRSIVSPSWTRITGSPSTTLRIRFDR